eukprot:TRINITY_DN6877_c0_g1_i1.p1 TRINITY_DN6877_c0_g1~~TRINITY_DN6877_c0_g1_i1.p1  ORF type:complete len:567 (+),score=184.82 TRINITY_DN6877_c0_g1_i1:1-1701(+)
MPPKKRSAKKKKPRQRPPKPAGSSAAKEADEVARVEESEEAAGDLGEVVVPRFADGASLMERLEALISAHPPAEYTAAQYKQLRRLFGVRPRSHDRDLFQMRLAMAVDRRTGHLLPQLQPAYSSGLSPHRPFVGDYANAAQLPVPGSGPGMSRATHNVRVPSAFPDPGGVDRHLVEQAIGIGVQPLPGVLSMLARNDFSGQVLKMMLQHMEPHTVNEKDENGNTPLLLACCRGNLAAVRVLLAANARLTIQDNFMTHPAAYVSQGIGCVSAAAPNSVFVEILDELLKAGLDPTRVKFVGHVTDWKMIVSSCELGSFEMVRLLMRHGCSVNARDPKSGITPLHNACRSGNTRLLKLLLKHGADTLVRTTEDILPVEYWTYSQNQRVPFLVFEHEREHGIDSSALQSLGVEAARRAAEEYRSTGEVDMFAGKMVFDMRSCAEADGPIRRRDPGALEEEHNQRRTCALCQVTHFDMKRCGLCGTVYYCSRECQAEDWPAHGPVCSGYVDKAAAERKAAKKRRRRERQRRRRQQAASGDGGGGGTGSDTGEEEEGEEEEGEHTAPEDTLD